MIGDLVKPLWGHLDALSSDFGVITGLIENDFSNLIYNVYWFQAGKTYPVFSHDLTLYEREQ